MPPMMMPMMIPSRRRGDANARTKTHALERTIFDASSRRDSVVVE